MHKGTHIHTDIDVLTSHPLINDKGQEDAAITLLLL